MEWQAARTAGSVVRPPTIARGRSAVKPVSAKATKPPARQAREMMCHASARASCTARASASPGETVVVQSAPASMHVRSLPRVRASIVCVAMAIDSDSCESVTPRLKQSKWAAEATGPRAAAAREQNAYTATLPQERAKTSAPAREYCSSTGPSAARLASAKRRRKASTSSPRDASRPGAAPALPAATPPASTPALPPAAGPPPPPIFDPARYPPPSLPRSACRRPKSAAVCESAVPAAAPAAPIPSGNMKSGSSTKLRPEKTSAHTSG
eukprot:scaffold8509_cov119-Isochrysis_galbana.AAC.1